MNSRNTLFKYHVIIDANFILLPFQFKIDYFEIINSSLEGGIQFIIFKQIFDELEAKKKREPKSTKFQKHFKSGILYLEKSKNEYNIINEDIIKEQEETTDDFILRKAIELKLKGMSIYIASNDKQLRNRAREANIGVIFLRQKKYLSIEGS